MLVPNFSLKLTNTRSRQFSTFFKVFLLNVWPLESGCRNLCFNIVVLSLRSYQGVSIVLTIYRLVIDSSFYCCVHCFFCSVSPLFRYCCFLNLFIVFLFLFVFVVLSFYKYMLIFFKRLHDGVAQTASCVALAGEVAGLREQLGASFDAVVMLSKDMFQKRY